MVWVLTRRAVWSSSALRQVRARPPSCGAAGGGEGRVGLLMEDDKALVENKAVSGVNKRQAENPPRVPLVKQSWFQSSADLLGCSVTIHEKNSVSVDSRGTEDNGSFKLDGLFF